MEEPELVSTEPVESSEVREEGVSQDANEVATAVTEATKDIEEETTELPVEKPETPEETPSNKNDGADVIEPPSRSSEPASTEPGTPYSPDIQEDSSSASPSADISEDESAPNKSKRHHAKLQGITPEGASKFKIKIKNTFTQ